MKFGFLIKQKWMSLANGENWCPFKKDMRWIVGNGEKNSLWYDNWVFRHATCEVFHVIVGCKYFTVAHFIS